jgi:membrane-associated phospholipid phosphatase
MDVYAAVFSPEYFMLMVGLLFLVHEWRASGRDWGNLGARLGVFFGCWLVAMAIYQSFPIVIADPLEWHEDVFAAAGMLLGLGLIAAVWQRASWGRILPGIFPLVVVQAVPYVLLSPFWNVSGHVAFTALPAVYATLVDRRYAVLLLVPLVMIANRPIVNAHTWLQSVAGFALAVLALVVATRVHLTDHQIPWSTTG